MTRFCKVLITLLVVCLVCVVASCNTQGISAAVPVKVSAGLRITKPPSSLQDTLMVTGSSAVFYYPDSLQLQEYIAEIDTNAYKSIDHEFFYQLHYAHLALKKYWPQVLVSDCKRYRYIKFIKPNKTFELIDLDTKGDIYGLFVFDGKKAPVQIDLTNVETQVGFYFRP